MIFRPALDGTNNTVRSALITTTPRRSDKAGLIRWPLSWKRPAAQLAASVAIVNGHVRFDVGPAIPVENELVMAFVALVHAVPGSDEATSYNVVKSLAQVSVESCLHAPHAARYIVSFGSVCRVI